jgi:hypothetical protein
MFRVPSKMAFVEAGQRRSTSFTESLRMYIRGHDCYFIHINKTGGMSVVRALDTKSDHPYPGRALEHSQQPRWRTAFKFSFVRNPWDKECSDYHYHSSLAHKETQQKALSFEEYLQIPEMHPHHVDHYWHSNQVDWLRSVNGEIEMDFIGRFENLAQYFGEVLKRLGIEGVELPHLNPSRHPPYSEIYTDETRAIVRDLYWKDIEYFGYRFGD